MRSPAAATHTVSTGLGGQRNFQRKSSGVRSRSNTSLYNVSRPGASASWKGRTCHRAFGWAAVRSDFGDWVENISILNIGLRTYRGAPRATKIGRTMVL